MALDPHPRAPPAQEYPWIASEKQFFGRPGSDYDWAATDCEKAFADFERGDEVVERLGKKVNRKVLSMFDKAEQEFKELSEKKRIVENDKDKIHQARCAARAAARA